MNTYNKLYESFKKNYESDEDAKGEFFTAFVKVAKKLAKLEIDDCFVDVGKRKRVIDFNIHLPHRIFISVCRYLDSNGETYELDEGGKAVVDDNTVFYKVDRDERTLSIGIIRIGEFVKKIREIEHELDEIEEKSKKSSERA